MSIFPMVERSGVVSVAYPQVENAETASKNNLKNPKPPSVRSKMNVKEKIQIKLKEIIVIAL